MEVSHNENPDTHTVIGGKNVKTASIALTKEFIAVLSDNIYTDKPLAVVREIMCNAWDSHIASGITNINIKVTLTEDKLIVRDFGLGIPDDMIQPIYYNYGASTKVQNEEETGGFGLGSKAPFAYTDHFTVTSYNNGTQTTYAMSKGSEETNGLPDLRTIVSIPTSQTGLEVTVPINEPSDRIAFRKIIDMIAKYGDMGVEFNGSVIDTYPFKEAVDDFLVVKKHSYIKGYDTIYLRYGTVIYPIPMDDFYDEEFTKIKYNILERSNDNIIVFNAPNNSISVNPSRETLSLTNKTKNTIKTLLSSFNQKIKENKEQVIIECIDELFSYCLKEYDENFIISAIKNNSFSILKNKDKKIELTNIEPITSIIDFCYNSIVYHNEFKESKKELFIPEKKFRKFILESILIHTPHLFKKLKIIFKRLIINSYDYNYRNEHKFTKLYSQFIINELKNSLGKYGKDLKIVNYSESKLMPANLSSISVNNAIIKKSIIIGFSVAAIKDKCIIESYCLNISRKKGIFEEIEKLLKENNILYIDCREFKPVKKIKDVNKVPRKKGYTALSYFIEHNSHFNTNVLSDVNRTIIEKPELVFYTSTRYGKKIIENYDSKKLKIISEVFPNAIVVSSSDTAINIENKFNLNHSTKIIEDLLLSYIDNEDFLLACSLLDEYEEWFTDLDDLIKISKYDKELSSLLKNKKVNVSKKMTLLANLYEAQLNVNRWSKGNLKPLHEKIKERKNPNTFIQNFQDNKLKQAFNLQRILLNLKQKTKESKDMLALLKLAII